MAPASAQPGIFALGTVSHYYLEIDLQPGADPGELVTELASLREPRRTTNGANLVVGIRPSLWSALSPSTRPAVDFTPVTGTATMPATQHDAWLWVAGGGYDVVFDTARAAMMAVSRLATLADHGSGFGYLDSRDLSGFEDGTENPALDDAVDVVAGEDGAGVVLVQRWVHDLGALHALDLADQEAVIGRTKATSEELLADLMPEDSHLSRVVIEDGEGEEREIFRRSTAFGDVVRHGLNFVGFSADQTVLASMLDRMAGVDDGRSDRVLTFSTPETGAYYVVPGLAGLRAFARSAD